MRLSPQDFWRHGAGVQVCIDSGDGDCVGDMISRRLGALRRRTGRKLGSARGVAHGADASVPRERPVCGRFVGVWAVPAPSPFFVS